MSINNEETGEPDAIKSTRGSTTWKDTRDDESFRSIASTPFSPFPQPYSFVGFNPRYENSSQTFYHKIGSQTARTCVPSSSVSLACNASITADQNRQGGEGIILLDRPKEKIAEYVPNFDGCCCCNYSTNNIPSTRDFTNTWSLTPYTPYYWWQYESNKQHKPKKYFKNKWELLKHKINI